MEKWASPAFLILHLHKQLLLACFTWTLNKKGLLEWKDARWEIYGGGRQPRSLSLPQAKKGKNAN